MVKMPWGFESQLKRAFRVIGMVRWPIGFILVLAILIVTVGCGKKAPPVPPPEKAPPAVSDLRHQIKDGQFELAWRVPADVAQDRERVAGFTVQRSKLSLVGEDCTDCPVVFSAVAEIDTSDEKRRDGQWVTFAYREALEQGFRYRYKVTAFGRGRITGTDSKVIDFTY